jgi:N-acyl-D-aspartate/D-glutamate deacylase
MQNRISQNDETSCTHGRTRLLVNNEEGWVPGQDVGGAVLQQAGDGSGPADPGQYLRAREAEAMCDHV